VRELLASIQKGINIQMNFCKNMEGNARVAY